MSTLKGLHEQYRGYLSQLAEKGQAGITIQKASEILQLPYEKTKLILIRLAKSGWLFRIKQGLYIPVPNFVDSEDVFAEEPWIIASAVFDPCYIGGWDAISYWGLTEQIFNETFVFTVNPLRQTKQEYLNHTFVVHQVPESSFFGLQTIWKQDIRLELSNPSRTLIDFLALPQNFGGIVPVYEIFKNYLESDHCDLDQLVDYACRLKNKAVSKRLGFLLECESKLNKQRDCQLHENMSHGNVKLVPQTKCPRLITKWRLWVPESWKEKYYDTKT